MIQKILLITAVIFSGCDSREWNISMTQNFSLHQESYDSISVLNFIPANGYRPNYIEIVNFDFLQKFPNAVGLSINLFNFGSFFEINYASKLKKLDLSRNKMKKLQENQLKNLLNLEILNLGQNSIESLCDGYLKLNKKLKKIYFHEIKIKKIPNLFFEDLLDLETIDFSSNQLTFLPHLLFRNNKKLKMVDFQLNKIQKLDPDIFIGLINLRGIYFYDNPCATGEWPENSNVENCFKNWEVTTKSIIDGVYKICHFTESII